MLCRSHQVDGYLVLQLLLLLSSIRRPQTLFLHLRDRNRFILSLLIKYISDCPYNNKILKHESRPASVIPPAHLFSGNWSLWNLYTYRVYLGKQTEIEQAHQW